MQVEEQVHTVCVPSIDPDPLRALAAGNGARPARLLLLAAAAGARPAPTFVRGQIPRIGRRVAAGEGDVAPWLAVMRWCAVVARRRRAGVG